MERENETGNERHDPYMQWIAQRALGSLETQHAVSGPRANDVGTPWDSDAVMRSVPTGPPKGTFRVVSTRDGEARARDGYEYYDINPRGHDNHGAELFEIRFGDGLWMLATDDDLDPNE